MDATMRMAERAGDEAAVAAARVRRGELVEGAVLVLDATLAEVTVRRFRRPAPKFWTGTWQVTGVWARVVGDPSLSLRRVRADGKALLPASRTNVLHARESVIRTALVNMGVPLALEDPAEVALRSIKAAETPEKLGEIRHEPRREWARKVRALLKGLGVVGVSVTVPNHSMAQAIDIEFDGLRHTHEPAGLERRDCAVCQRNHRAERRLEGLILAAYPDLNNRSDSMVDHFDYCLSVRSK